MGEMSENFKYLWLVLVPEIDTDVDVATAARFEYLGKNEEELAGGYCSLASTRKEFVFLVHFPPSNTLRALKVFLAI